MRAVPADEAIVGARHATAGRSAARCYAWAVRGIGPHRMRKTSFRNHFAAEERMGLVAPGIDDRPCLARAAKAFGPGFVGARDSRRIVEHGIDRAVLGHARDFRV